MAYLDKVNRGFKKIKKDGVVYYTPASFSSHVDLVFCGDVSNGLDFKAIRKSSMEDMQRGFKGLCGVLNIPYEKCLMTNIVHGNEIAIVNYSHAGLGVSSPVKLPPCDGLVTNVPGLPIASTHADCMPIAYYDKAHNVGCVIHAGWRGVLARIHEKGINTLLDSFNSDPKDILVAIGPTINQCCFYVGSDVTDDFTREFATDDFVCHDRNKDRLDLTSIVLKFCEKVGILPKNITIDGRCTACKDSGLASYRRDKDEAGTMVQLMVIKDKRK